MITRLRLSRSALFTCGLLLVLMAVPVVLTWRVSRQERLNQEAEVNRKQADRATALAYAVQAGRAENVRLLLNKGADPNARLQGVSLLRLSDSALIAIQMQMLFASHPVMPPGHVPSKEERERMCTINEEWLRWRDIHTMLQQAGAK